VNQDVGLDKDRDVSPDLVQWISFRGP